MKGQAHPWIFMTVRRDEFEGREGQPSPRGEETLRHSDGAATEHQGGVGVGRGSQGYLLTPALPPRGSTSPPADMALLEDI